MKKLSPEKFIEAIRESDEYMEMIFMNGGCYDFYKLLKTVYPRSKAYMVKLESLDYNHIITKIGKKYYDINGKFVMFDEDIAPAKDTCKLWSFSRQKYIYRTCPECGEEVPFFCKHFGDKPEADKPPRELLDEIMAG